MRSKKKDKTKKYVAGGMFVLPALQAGLGAYQMIQGNRMAQALEEPSLSKPSEYADMLKLAQNQQVEDKRLENLNRSISTGMAAAQAGGGRALVGSLPGMVRAGDKGTLDILAKRQADQMNALKSSAFGSEREINRNVAAYGRDMGAAQAAVEGGLQNIGGAAGQAGLMALYGGKSSKGGNEADPLKLKTAPDIGSKEAGSSLINEGIDSDLAYEEKLLQEELNKTKFLEGGGKMTKGSFNHDINPIDIVQKGVKVGEMTGGEVILNPKQQARLSKESAYFRNLLKKFNKKK